MNRIIILRDMSFVTNLIKVIQNSYKYGARDSKIAHEFQNFSFESISTLHFHGN